MVQPDVAGGGLPGVQPSLLQRDATGRASSGPCQLEVLLWPPRHPGTEQKPIKSCCRGANSTVPLGTVHHVCKHNIKNNYSSQRIVYVASCLFWDQNLHEPSFIYRCPFLFDKPWSKTWPSTRSFSEQSPPTFHLLAPPNRTIK